MLTKTYKRRIAHSVLLLAIAAMLMIGFASSRLPSDYYWKRQESSNRESVTIMLILDEDTALAVFTEKRVELPFREPLTEFERDICRRAVAFQVDSTIVMDVDRMKQYQPSIFDVFHFGVFDKHGKHHRHTDDPQSASINVTFSLDDLNNAKPVVLMSSNQWP